MNPPASDYPASPANSSGTKATAPVPVDSAAGNPKRRLPAGTFHIPKVTPEDRRRILTAIHVQPEEGWVQRFTVMITLSALVAVMGLDLNSPALVIGAMLIAPLMAPVLGLAASIAMALGGHAARSAFTVILATAGVILLSYLLARLLPNQEIPNEVLSRTRPDIRDLVVGIAAGAAGAYATVRSDMSSSLPGVAVAVALVPPLCVVGYLLEAGSPALAQGAFLLYFANLSAIVFAGALVFVITGLVPQRRLSTMSPWVFGGLAVAAVATALIAIPLAFSSSNLYSNARQNQQTYEAVVAWIGNRNLEIVGDVDIDDKNVLVSLEGPDQPDFTESLRSQLIPIWGDDVDVDVQLTRTTRAAPDAPEVEPPSDIEVFRGDVEEIIDDWLEASSADSDYTVSNLSIEADEITGTITGSTEPPDQVVLAEAILEATGQQPEVTITRIRTESLVVEQAPEPTTEEVETARLRRVANEWADTTANSGNPIVVNDLILSPGGVIVEISGDRAPRIDSLHALLSDAIDLDDPDIEVRYIPRRVLTTTPPTTLPPPTTLAPDNPDGEVPEGDVPDAVDGETPPTTIEN